MDNKTTNVNIKKKRGRTALFYQKRRSHVVYYNDREWDIISSKSAHLDMDRGVYIREVSLGYKPTIPDRDFRQEMMRVRDDVKKLFQILESLNLSREKRLEKITEFGFLQRWTNGVKDELDFLDRWIKKV